MYPIFSISFFLDPRSSRGWLVVVKSGMTSGGQAGKTLCQAGFNSVLESKAQMQAETVEGDGRAEEDVQVSVAPDPDAWLPAA